MTTWLILIFLSIFVLGLLIWWHDERSERRADDIHKQVKRADDEQLAKLEGIRSHVATLKNFLADLWRGK